MLRIICFLQAAAAICAPWALLQAEDTGGKFNIFQNGKQIASETYTLEHTGDRVQLSGSGSAEVGTLKISIDEFRVVTDKKYQPLEASAKAKLGEMTMAVKSSFDGNKVHSEIDTGQGAQSKDEEVHPGVLVISSNVPLFPLTILAERLDLQSPAPQKFSAWVIGQVEAPVTVTLKGKDTVEFAESKVSLQRVSVSLETPQAKIDLDLWMDDERRIVKMVVPSQSVEVYREGYQRKAAVPASAPVPATPAPNPNLK